jgi:hypothetical protein
LAAAAWTCRAHARATVMDFPPTTLSISALVGWTHDVCVLPKLAACCLTAVIVGIVALTALVNNALNLVTGEHVPTSGGCLNIFWILLTNCLSMKPELLTPFYHLQIDVESSSLGARSLPKSCSTLASCYSLSLRACPRWCRHMPRRWRSVL